MNKKISFEHKIMLLLMNFQQIGQLNMFQKKLKIFYNNNNKIIIMKKKKKKKIIKNKKSLEKEGP